MTSGQLDHGGTVPFAVHRRPGRSSRRQAFAFGLQPYGRPAGRRAAGTPGQQHYVARSPVPEPVPRTVGVTKPRLGYLPVVQRPAPVRSSSMGMAAACCSAIGVPLVVAHRSPAAVAIGWALLCCFGTIIGLLFRRLGWQGFWRSDWDGEASGTRDRR
jgi:hypothetical protein